MKKPSQCGMFGTLVVVLSGRFEGGELAVHHPSQVENATTGGKGSPNTYVFDAATMDPFALKYAAFYGDCPHEVQPVTKGYRVCLPYNLVKVASSTTTAVMDPKFGSNHVLYKTLKTAMDQFFCEEGADKSKHQRLNAGGGEASAGFDVADPKTHRDCKLVYILTHQYTEANLSFSNLKNRDAAVAACLTRYCDASDCFLSVFLCKIEYLFMWIGEEGAIRTLGVERSLAAKALVAAAPITTALVTTTFSVDASGGLEELEPFAEGDLQADVAPYGVFQRKDFKFDGQNNQLYTGNEGASSNRWYSSAALVVAPLQVSTSWALREGVSKVRQKWFELADTKSAHARVIARLFGDYKFEWSTTSPLGIQILETLTQLADADAVSGVISAFASVEFQPKLRDVVAQFDPTTLAKITKTVDQKWRGRRMNAERNRCNFIASVLDGVVDRSTIAEVVEASDIVPSVKSDSAEEVELSKGDTTPEEFARLLHLASLVSEGCVKGILDSSQVRSLGLVGMPGIQLLLAATRDHPSKRAVVLACVNHALDLAKENLPAIRAMSCKSGFGCYSYYSINVFESHLKKKLKEANLLDRLSIESSSDSAEPKVVLKKVYESALFKKAHEEIAGLNAMVAEFVRVAVVNASRGAGSN